MSEEALKNLVARRPELIRWQSPAEFVAKVEELAAPIENDPLFNEPAAGFLHDAMVLAEFTKFRPTESVRLVDQRDQWPDGQIGSGKQPINVEITEVMEEGRRRGDEYRAGMVPSQGQSEDWRRRAQAIPARLDEAIQRKLKKGYAGECMLLVYVNMSNYGILQKETEAAIGALKQKYAGAFKEICVLWQEKLL